MKWIIRVNTRTGKIVKQEATSEEMHWGGRLLVSKFLLREVPPICDPLGRHNKLIIAPGLLGDTVVTTTGKFSVGGKSPLTRGVKESDVGGEAGKKIARLGIKALVLEEIPDKPGTKILFVKANETTLLEFPELKGKQVSETIQILRGRVWPSGGNHLHWSCRGDEDGRGRRGCDRCPGYPGPVCGAGRAWSGHGVKGSQGNRCRRYRRRATSGLLMRAFFAKRARPWLRPSWQTPRPRTGITTGPLRSSWPVMNSASCPRGISAPVNLKRRRSFQENTLQRSLSERGGEGRSGTPCVRGCVISCSNVFPDPSGKKTVASIQYENIALLGPNCGIGNVDDIAELNDLCNQVGVCAIETGAAIGVAMEAGVIPFGDAEGAKDLIRQIGRGTYLGRILGNGAVITGKVLGVRRVPAIKGQAIPAYDPRSLKGNGVTYTTSPMGADHTAGNALETAKTVNPLAIENQVENSRRLQIRAAILDTMGLCLFTRPPFVKRPDLFAMFLKGRYGWDLTYEGVQKIGVDALETEREFNRRAGVSEEFFDVPEFMREEPLPPRNSVFDIPLEEMKRIWTVKVPKDVF